MWRIPFCCCPIKRMRLITRVYGSPLWLYLELHEAMIADKCLKTKGQMTEVMVRRESLGQ